MQRAIAITLFIASLATIAVAQQDKSKRPSPPASATCKFSDGKTIKVDYSSPRAKGRKIYGGLVPYGKVWRTGANEATTFVTDTNLTAGGKDIPAGSYTLFTVPNEGKWTLVISKKTGEWGTDYPGEGEDLARIDMDTEKTSGPVENFTITFHEMGSQCHIYLDWENTRAMALLSEKK
ncbi:MAG TPA: DUF2911 domain-containing protein [Terriglobales bacterium]|jgi:hypothetical protein